MPTRTGRLLRTAPAIVAALALFGAGCGDDSSDGSGGTTESSPAEYRASLESICGDLTPEVGLTPLSEVVAVREIALSELEALTPPTELADAHGALVASETESIRLAGAMAEFSERTGWQGGALPPEQRANVANAVAANIVSEDALGRLGVNCGSE